jgi:hypothetical protein
LHFQVDTLERHEAVAVDLAEIFNGKCWYHAVPNIAAAPARSNAPIKTRHCTRIRPAKRHSP